MTVNQTETKPLTVVCVCTGNICRSALAHHYLARALSDTHPDAFRVVSGGTGWHPGLAVPDDLIAAVPDLTDRLRGHTPGYLRIDELRAADLVLTATQEQRRFVLSEAPFALQRTFTIMEFSQILAGRSLRPGREPDAWRAAIAESARFRGGYAADDIADPYRRGPEAYAAMRDQLLPALDVLIRAAGLTGEP